MSDAAGRQRIDKWLWFARFAKTRTLAQKLVEAGRVRVNRERINAASQIVRPGDVLTMQLERQVRVVRIVDPGTRRGPASEAQTLYEDLTPPPPPRDSAARNDVATPGGPRPTKRDRRVLDAWHSSAAGGTGNTFPDDDED
jgi:ribosome-associated heat shock protein Hsp15